MALPGKGRRETEGRRGKGKCGGRAGPRGRPPPQAAGGKVLRAGRVGGVGAVPGESAGPRGSSPAERRPPLPRGSGRGAGVGHRRPLGACPRNRARTQPSGARAKPGRTPLPRLQAVEIQPQAFPRSQAPRQRLGKRNFFWLEESLIIPRTAESGCICTPNTAFVRAGERAEATSPFVSRSRAGRAGAARFGGSWWGRVAGSPERDTRFHGLADIGWARNLGVEGLPCRTPLKGTTLKSVTELKVFLRGPQRLPIWN